MDGKALAPQKLESRVVGMLSTAIKKMLIRSQLHIRNNEIVCLDHLKKLRINDDKPVRSLFTKHMQISKMSMLLTIKNLSYGNTGC